MNTVLNFDNPYKVPMELVTTKMARKMAAVDDGNGVYMAWCDRVLERSHTSTLHRMLLEFGEMQFEAMADPAAPDYEGKGWVWFTIRVASHPSGDYIVLDLKTPPSVEEDPENHGGPIGIDEKSQIILLLRNEAKIHGIEGNELARFNRIVDRIVRNLENKPIPMYDQEAQEAHTEHGIDEMERELADHVRDGGSEIW